jgi:hypothetical protein
MNDYDSINEARLGRLVDGELSGEEYREFLQSLEREPDGWRRTAMAFLEAQAFGQELTSLRQEIEVAPQKIGTATNTPSARRLGLAKLALAMAASFLVAFGLGAWWRSDSFRAGTSPAPSVVSGNPNSGAETELAQQVVPADDESPRAGVPQEQLTFVVDRGDGQSDRFDMPMYDKDDAYARWLVEQPALPMEVERDLRRAGYRIERQRQWAPVRLRDGRRAVFPVDDLQITPVSNRTY